MQPERIAFYPCCARDYPEPLSLLVGHVDHVLFCDVRTSPSRTQLDDIRQRAKEDYLPRASFMLGDAMATLNMLCPFDVFFYRRDSSGEGGSDIWFLGVDLLPVVLKRIKPGGLIITDGSNGGDKWLSKISATPKASYHVGDRRLSLTTNQPFHEMRLSVVRAD